MGFIRKIKRGGKAYLAEVKNVRIEGKVVQRHIRYIGKEADGKTILSSSISNIQIDDVKIFGPLLVLNQIAKSIKLDQVLGKYSQEILSMVYAHCVDYRSLNQMQSWYQRTDLNFLLNLNNLTESKLVSALDYLENLNSTELQKNIFDNVKGQYEINGDGIVYDVTNTYFYGKRCSLGRYGKDKEGRKENLLIQIGLGVTQKEGIPVFHKVYDGNTHDSRTFQDAITCFEEYKIKDGIFVFDRGVTSKQAQSCMKKIKWKVLCGFSLTDRLKELIELEIKNKRFSDIKNRVLLNKTMFYVVQKDYVIGDVKGKLAICFNEQQRLDLNHSLYNEIMNAKILLSNKKTIKSGLEKFFSKSGKLLTEQIEKEEKFHGYSCIFTTAKLTPAQMIHHYFEKDLVEKAFQSLKGVVRLRPVRHWLYNRVIAHVFICYLSYLLLSILKLRLSKINLSPVKALQELDTLYKVYMHDSKKGFKISRVVALNKMQEKILKTVDKNLIQECRQ